jgi:hypothetical protein
LNPSTFTSLRCSSIAASRELLYCNDMVIKGLQVRDLCSHLPQVTIVCWIPEKSRSIMEGLTLSYWAQMSLRDNAGSDPLKIAPFYVCSFWSCSSRYTMNSWESCWAIGSNFLLTSLLMSGLTTCLSVDDLLKTVT